MNKTGIEIITNTLDRSIEDVLRVMSRAESSALRAGANVIVKKAKDNAAKIGVDVTGRSVKYNDRLIDAIRSSRVKDGAIVAHTMGSGRTGSGTFRMRFYEGGTKVRYQKKVNGIPLKKPRKLGFIMSTPFFEPAVNASRQEVMTVMSEKLRSTIERAWNNNK